MFLAVTPIEEFWNKNDELLFIGPWCALYDRRRAWEKLRHRFLPDPWRDSRRFRAAADYCRESSDHLLGELVGYLNGVLGASRDARAWRILLDPWLTYHVEQMYDHFVHVEDALASAPDLKTIRLDPASFVTPVGTEDFMRLAIGDFFHLQMFSAILAAKLPDSPARRLEAPAPPAPPSGAKNLLKDLGAGVLRTLTPPGAGEILFTELGLDRSEKLRLIYGSRLRMLPYLATLPASLPASPVQDGRRLGLASLPGRDEFERLFVSLLPVHFPSLYLEGHDAARRFTASSLKRTPRSVFTAIGCHYDDSFKFAAAECVERGAELWGHQHGGGYGMAEYSPAEDFERAVSDRYYAWGWAELAADPKVRNLPPPMLTRNGPPAPGRDILFVSTSLDLHNIRLCINHERAFDSLERQARLLRSIPSPARDRVFFRAHTDFGWRHRERIRELHPGVRFDDRALPFSRRLRAARLAVFDCPSTPMLEALAAGVPCVMSWNPDLHPFRPAAASYIDGLRKAGVLFDSPEEAAAQIGRVDEDPRAWWDEPGRSAVLRDFTRMFARASSDWLADWLKEFDREAAAK